jgi:hypothetical protein
VPSGILFVFTRLFDFFLGFWRDPMTFTIQVVVLILLLFLLYMLVKHPDRVLFLFTGDPTIHLDLCSVLSRGAHFCSEACVPCFCCGTGECTRWFTSSCCCRLCCPQLYRQNLLTACGRALGFEAYAVQIKNIAIGDLPGTDRQSFYVCFECKTDPAMVTSVAEYKLPKLVPFPETITVRMRNTMFESPLRITVRRLKRPIGFEEIAEVHFSAGDVLHWSGHLDRCCCCSCCSSCCDPHSGIRDDDPGTTHRFKMRLLNGVDPLTVTPPWISLKFEEPKIGQWEHTTDTLPDEFMGAYCCCDTSAVVTQVAEESSTLTFDVEASRRAATNESDQRRSLFGVLSRAPPQPEQASSGSFFVGWPWQFFDARQRTQRNTVYEQIPIQDFKSLHVLREPNGVVTFDEMPERRVRVVSACGGACYICQMFMQLVFFMSFWIYILLRSYVESCWDLYLNATPLILINRTWGNISSPVTKEKADGAQAFCQKRRQQKAVYDFVLPVGRPCNPSPSQVLAICADPTVEVSGNAWEEDVGDYNFFPRCWKGSEQVPSACQAYVWMGTSHFDAWASLYFFVIVVLWFGTRASKSFFLRNCERCMFSWWRRHSHRHSHENREYTTTWTENELEFPRK